MMSKEEILIISHDIVGRRMAGPGIRYSELARVLADSFHVTLAVPGTTDLKEQAFAICPYCRGEWSSLAPAAHRAHVIVTPGDSLSEFPVLETLPTPLVVDGYDPHTLETLALWSGEPLDVQTARHGARLDILRRQCRAADLVICASERQRDWWLGLLEQAGRINPHTYSADPSLRSLVDVVPFGLPSEPPRARRAVIRGVWPGISAEDLLLLWGGGLWEWLDPLTAVRAVDRLVEEGWERVRLVFPGTRHPNPDMPEMPLRAQTMALSDELHLTGTHVFFGDWVHYEDWPAVLLEADVGLSLHRDTVEARLAFRSRVLDYIWAGLSSVLTRGDAIADTVSSYSLGRLTDFGDDGGVADAIASLLDEPIPGSLFGTARQALTWEHAAAPLVAFCREPRRAADRRPSAAREQGGLLPEPNRSPSAHQAGVARYETESLIQVARWVGSLRDGLSQNRLFRFWQDRKHTQRFYGRLAAEVGEASNHAFVDRAYWRILQRTPDSAGFEHFTSLLEQGELSRRGIVASLVASPEFRNQPRPRLGVTETLHLLRCQLVSQLPRADHVLDLGGAAPGSLQGSLMVMGYPHRVDSLTIVDLPPADRQGHYLLGDSEAESTWIETEMGQIRYLHVSMTDLSAITSSSIDLVFAGQSIEHVSRAEGWQVLREVLRVLRPGGHFCLDTPNAAILRIQSPSGFLHPEHQVEYHVEELLAGLREVGFEIVELKGMCPMPRTYQQGVFDEQELLSNARLSDDAERSYLFYVHAIKRVESNGQADTGEA